MRCNAGGNKIVGLVVMRRTWLQDDSGNRRHRGLKRSKDYTRTRARELAGVAGTLLAALIHLPAISADDLRARKPCSMNHFRILNLLPIRLVDGRAGSLYTLCKASLVRTLEMARPISCDSMRNKCRHSRLEIVVTTQMAL